MSRLHMHELHPPLSPIQEDAHSDDEDEGDDDSAHVHFTLGGSPHDGSPSNSSASITLHQPPTHHVYHNNHHRSHSNPQIYYPNGHLYQKHQTNHYSQRPPATATATAQRNPHPRYNNNRHSDEHSVSEALVQFVHEKTEAMLEEERTVGERTEARNTAKDYLWFSILSCVCCCPLGTVAVWYSRRVTKCNKTGDVTRARKQSKKALGFCILALVCDVIILIIVILVKFGALIFKDLKFSIE